MIENGKSPESITLNGGDSWLFLGTTEDLRAESKAKRAKQKAEAEKVEAN